MRGNSAHVIGSMHKKKKEKKRKKEKGKKKGRKFESISPLKLNIIHNLPIILLISKHFHKHNPTLPMMKKYFLSSPLSLQYT